MKMNNIARSKVMHIGGGIIGLIIVVAVWHIFATSNKFTTCFPDNPFGEAIALNYQDDFIRISEGKMVASITKWGNGFFGVYYGDLYYFNEKDNTIYDVEIPNGFHSIYDVKLDEKDETYIWDATGVFYDSIEDFLYIANYRGHNILVCSVELKDEIPRLVVNNIYSFDGMKSPENVYSINGIIAVADYDGNALWILNNEGELIKKVKVRLAHGVAISKDAIFVSSLQDRKIYKYSYSGTLISEVGYEAYEGKDSFLWPTGLDVTANELIITDAHTGRISIYDFELNFISSLGGYGPSDNAFNFPYCSNWFNDSLYIADVFNSRIVIVSNDGKIKKIWGNQIDNIGLDIIYHQSNDIPYTYGVINEVDGYFFNPYFESEVTLGYDSLWFKNGDNIQINSTDYKCNEEALHTNVPRLDQLYVTWIKKYELDEKVYFVMGSPESSGQLYIYNVTDDVFFISVWRIPSIWYVDGQWYCEDDEEVFTKIIYSAKDAIDDYLRLVNDGIENRQAYVIAFLDYYNSLYDTMLVDEMSETDLYIWIKSFFSTESGKEFWNNYSCDSDEMLNITMAYYESTQYGNTHLCELLMVKMFGKSAYTSETIEINFTSPGQMKWYAQPVPYPSFGMTILE